MLHGISQIFLSNMFLEKGSRMILNDNNKGILGGWRTHYGNYQKNKPENMTNTKFLHFFKPFPLVTVASIDKISGVLFFLYFLWMKVPKACCSSQLYLPSASQWFGLVHLQHMRFGWGTWTRKDASKENCDIVMWECESSLFGKWKALTNINFSWFPPHFPTSPSS